MVYFIAFPDFEGDSIGSESRRLSKENMTRMSEVCKLEVCKLEACIFKRCHVDLIGLSIVYKIAVDFVL